MIRRQISIPMQTKSDGYLVCFYLMAFFMTLNSKHTICGIIIYQPD